MTDSPAAPPLHPSLRPLGVKQHRLMLMLNMALFLAISGGIIAMMAVTFSGGDLFDLLLLMVVGLLVMPLVALLNGLLRYVDRRLARQLEQAGQLLRDSPPLAARLTPTGLTHRAGTLVAMRPSVGGAAKADPIHALINPSFRWSVPPSGEIAIQLYCRDLRPGEGLVALQPDGTALLGRLVELETYSRQIRLWAIASLALLLIVVMVVGTLGVRECRDYRQADQYSRVATASGNWPQVPATVLRAELVSAQITKGKIRTTGYRAQVDYRYFVAGTMRESDNFRFCDRPTANRQAAEARLAQYPAGAAVVARYDPTDPARAVLEAGYAAACESELAEKRLTVMLYSAIAGLLLLLALLVLGQYRKHRRLLPLSNARAP